MRILIIGSGGREHALGWKIKQSPIVKKIYFVPGNAGTSFLGENVNIEPEEIDKLLEFAKEQKIDLSVVGPEIPLALGIVDIFERNNLKIFGPSRKASQLESSKVWAIKFIQRNNIPCPQSYVFNNFKKALSFVNKISWKKMVVKASGLAAGKGVIICNNKTETISAVKKIMIDKEFGNAGNQIVIQEKLDGQEVSVLAFTDGKTIIPLLPAQDHKPIFENNKGPNTGGMGAYAPVPFINKELLQKIKKTVLQPTIDNMRKEGNIYKGVLYAGLMITKAGPKVLEFNARFGDPETQPLMMLLSSDLIDIINACIEGSLVRQKIKFKNGSSVCVVLSSAGYPGYYNKGEIIYGLTKIRKPAIQVFHAGTSFKDNKVITSGGRVLGVTSSGKNLKQAIKKAYGIIGKHGVYFKNMHYRKDIGKKAL